MKTRSIYKTSNTTNDDENEVGRNRRSSHDMNDDEMNHKNSKKRPYIEVVATTGEESKEIEEANNFIIERTNDDDGFAHDDDKNNDGSVAPQYLPYEEGEVKAANELSRSALVEKNSTNSEDDDDDDNDDNVDGDDDDDDDDDFDYDDYKKLKFLEYCNIFRSNNKCQQTVFIDTRKVPSGCLQQIGDAIVQNTHINELRLDMKIMEHETQLEGAFSLFQFVRNSQSLKKVAMSSHGIESRQSSTNAERLANLIYRAITDNQFIQDLDITAPYSSNTFDILISTSSSIKTLHLRCYDNLVDADLRDRFLRTLKSNHSVDNLSLSIGPGGWSWLEEIPSHIGNGPSTLRGLVVVACNTASRHFFNLVSTTTSLHTLTLSGCLWDDLTLGHLKTAFAMNASIVHLKLEEHDNDDMIMIDKILLSLHNGPSTLRKLTLVSKEDNFGALQQYLCTPTAAALQHLELYDCDMDIRSVNDLVKGLQVLESHSSATAMIELTLKSCHLTKKATNHLVKFITARSNRHCHHDNDRPETHLLPELDCVNTMYPAPELCDFPGISRFHGVNRLNVMEVSMSTKAYGVALLSMYPLGNVPSFCDALTDTATTSPLVCLQLSNIEHDDSVKLARCLSHMTSLRALHLVGMQEDVSQSMILNGLRNNGSLFTATFTMDEKQPFFPQERYKILIQSYFQRNRFLSQIMLTKSSALSCSHTMNPTNTAKDEEDDDDDDTIVCLAVVPTLICAAKAIPLTRPRFFMSVLLALGSTVGPKQEIVV